MELVIKHFSQLTPDELLDIFKLRVSVFVVEQNCPYQEIDEADRQAYHIYLKEDNKIQAYVRLLPPNVTFDTVAIGRVISAKRGCGLGYKIFKSGIQAAQDIFGAKTIKIEAQTYAKGFYEKFGFKQSSEEFLEDGIEHIEMTLNL